MLIESKVFRHVKRRLLSLPLYGQQERVFLIMHNYYTHCIYLCEVPNRADESDWNFKASWSDICKVRERDMHTVIGLIHTHPDPAQPNPSIRDYNNATKTEHVYGVYQPLLRRLVWYCKRGRTSRVEYLKYTIRRRG